MVVCGIAYWVPTGAFPFQSVMSPPSEVRYSVSFPPHAFKSVRR